MKKSNKTFTEDLWNTKCKKMREYYNKGGYKSFKRS